MPIFYPEFQIYVKDKKPPRICRWHECPLQHSGYEGIKMKVCARCNFVRYCSKRCQRSDWPTHKRGCRVPQFLDMGSWIRAYRWLLEWAAMEALQVQTNSMKIVNQCLVIDVLGVDRVVGPSPSPFVIFKAQVSDITEELSGETEASLAIKESGGMGQALVILQFHSMLGGNVVTRNLERFEFRDPPLPASEAGGYAHFAQWEGVLKGIANGTLGVSDISHQLRNN